MEHFGCGHEKSDENTYTNPKNASPSCKECRRVAAARYAAKNKEQLARYHREYAKEHREDLRAAHRRWLDKQPKTEESLETKRAYQREWYRKNRSAAALKAKSEK